MARKKKPNYDELLDGQTEKTDAAEISVEDDEDSDGGVTRPPKTYVPIEANNIISTGSTLLDLEISGGRIRGGGIPGGIVIEVFGKSSGGKTGLLVSIGSNVQHKGGEVRFGDPESRLDKEYTAETGLILPKNCYSRPSTIDEAFSDIKSWEPERSDVINMYGMDSLAALMSAMENEDEDKRGQARAKEFHKWLRKLSRNVAEQNKLMVFSNQERDSEQGFTTTGGTAITFWSSLRLRIQRKSRYDVKKKLASGAEVTRTLGIISTATIVKSSVWNEHGIAPLYFISGYGIDDVRASLQWYKDMTKADKYNAGDKEFVAMNKAIEHVEKTDGEAALRDRVIDLWEEICRKFDQPRKKKVRF